jgi:hypothetical protein
MSLDTTNGMPGGPTPFTAFAPQRNGTSGIIIDNVSNVAQFPQASSIYFTNEGTGNCGDGSVNMGCAVKLTQSGLK